MEVGSGSGGTSVVVMDALAQYAERVELTYTDISPQLVAYGRRTYGQQYPFVRFHVLDVEKDVVPQVGSCCATSRLEMHCRAACTILPVEATVPLFR